MPSKKRIKHVRVRRNTDQHALQYSSLEFASIKHRPTFGIQVFGFFLTICLGAASFLISLMFVSLVTKRLFIRDLPGWSLAAGIIFTLFCMCAANPLARRFCHYLKYAHLRNIGIIAEATVVGYKWSGSFRGPEQIDLIVVWQHPVTGQTYAHERHYIFFWELFSEKKADIFKSYYAGAYLPLVFNPKRPQYFVLEIPFVPCWFDVLF